MDLGGTLRCTPGARPSASGSREGPERFPVHFVPVGKTQKLNSFPFFIRSLNLKATWLKTVLVI
jgi:hypothetical protein